MYLEVQFEDGQTGRYPCTPGSTVTIMEPPAIAGELGATFAFALDGVAEVALVQGELSPPAAPAPAPVVVPADEVLAGSDPAAAAPSAAPPTESTSGGSSPADPVGDTPAGLDVAVQEPPAGQPPAQDSPPPVAGPIAAVADANTAWAAVEAASGQLTAAMSKETPEEQLAHATAVKADLQAALEKWPADPDLTDALSLVETLIVDLTPAQA